MITHGVLWSWNFGKCGDFLGFFLYVDEGVNQGSGVVGGRVLDVLIFRFLY